MLEDIVAAAQTRLAERLVTVTVVNGNGHYQVRAHEEQLRQVFSRLLDNAIRFSPKGGHVTVRIMRDGETIRIAVADQGVGMTPEQVEMAFDRMRQINRAEQQQQGIGMSLSLIRSLVEIHGGTITSESVPGHGTTFTVALPRVEPQD
jgi:two-component system sensor histidine kinase BaeS